MNPFFGFVFGLGLTVGSFWVGTVSHFLEHPPANGTSQSELSALAPHGIVDRLPSACCLVNAPLLDLWPTFEVSTSNSLRLARKISADSLGFIFCLELLAAGVFEIGPVFAASLISFSDRYSGLLLIRLLISPILSAPTTDFVWCLRDFLLADSDSLLYLPLFRFWTALVLKAEIEWYRTSGLFRHSNANSWRYLYSSWKTFVWWTEFNAENEAI